MPVIETKYVDHLCKDKRTFKRRIVVCKCDQCEKIYERRQQNSKLTFCSSRCSSDARKKGGRLFTQTCDTNMQRYGVSFTGQVEKFKEQAQNTNLERYGVKSQFQRPDVHQKGIEAAWFPESREKAKQSYIKHYGVENPAQSDEVQALMTSTRLERYGVEHHWMLDSVKEQRRQTWQEHYGVDNPFQAEEVKEKITETNVERYGVEHPNQCPEIRSKGVKTRKKSQILIHWKTSEELVCTASYEIAFVNWCNENQIDFDWQVRIQTSLLTPKGKKSFYFIDAFIKSGEFKNTWVEIKGRLFGIGKQKWEWFHSEHPNDSQLWNRERLLELGILSA